MNICVVGGAGYVGLITSMGLAEIGHQVFSVDVDRGRLEQLKRGKSPIYEEGIESVLKINLESGRLIFTDDLCQAVSRSDVVFIAVGTPAGHQGQADLSNVTEVTERLAGCLQGYKVIAIKSTVPVGSIDLIRDILQLENREGTDFDIVANPEFLSEGKGLHDFFCPDRIVIGSSSAKATEIMRAVYQPISQGKVFWREWAGDRPPPGNIPVIETSLVSAQMIKYASNAFLGTRLSFINEIAEFCETLGADIDDVINGMGFDPRIGHRYLAAGLGFGGPCLEKDLSALIRLAEVDGHEPLLLRAVLDRNDRQLAEAIPKLRQLICSRLYGKVIAVFGLAFKAGTNDLRNSMALRVIDRLREEGAIVRAYDPVAMPEVRALEPTVECWDDPYDAVQQADALMILTEWPCFAELDYEKIRAAMASPYIVDGRNLLDPVGLRAMGFSYVGVGRL